MSDELEIEYAVCYGGIEAGMRVLNRDLAPRPGCVDAYHGALDEYRKKGIPVGTHGRPGPRLTKIALALILVK